MHPRNLIRILATALLAAVAVVVGLALWQHYMQEPWTRDGRVHADVIRIAPDVSGLVTNVAVRDNQLVHRGDLLLSIDAQRYRDAVAQAKAAVAAQEVTLAQRRRELQRRRGLSGAVVASEDVEVARAKQRAAVARLDSDRARLATAQLNLARTQVRAPTDGYVTHLQIFQGDYAVTGHPLMALVDNQSFRVDGYFEETKLRHIRVGDAVSVYLLGGGPTLHGHVQSIARGINNRDDADGHDLLATVSPTFSWVRLAQRVPVRVRLDSIPDGLDLAAGMTCTVVVHPPMHDQRSDAQRS